MVVRRTKTRIQLSFLREVGISFLPIVLLKSWMNLVYIELRLLELLAVLDIDIMPSCPMLPFVSKSSCFCFDPSRF